MRDEVSSVSEGVKVGTVYLNQTAVARTETNMKTYLTEWLQAVCVAESS